MAILKGKWHWFIGIGFGLLFLLLLAFRLDVFKWGQYQFSQIKDGTIPGIPTSQTFHDKESWMNISQNERKIGYAHRIFSSTGKGYHFVETVFMQINTMGVVQGMTFKTDGYLNPDMTLSSFAFDLRSSLFSFKAHGVVQNKQVTLYTEMPGSEKKTVIALKDMPHLANGILESAEIAGMKLGESRSFHVFDPATMGQRPVKVTVLSDDKVTIMGKSRKARRVSVDFMGAKQFAWIDEDGDILKEQGILGITLEQVSKHQALGGITLTSGADLTEIASVPSNMIIDDPAALTSLKVKISNVEKENLKLNGGRQTLKKDTLLIQKETIPTRPLRETSMAGSEDFLKPSPFIQSDHQKIIAKVQDIISPDDPVAVKASKLVAWVYKNVEKRPVLSVPNALETLNNLVGDCNEHAVLLAALARAAGIPAQVEVGLVYQRERFYYHAWNVFFIGTWITADAVMGQMPADVTHIRFARGDVDQQIDLIGVIGKVRIRVLEKSR
ncbi:MAG TPA: transglutaminase-like domain-containing protein [Syntrophales bacterium]|nr:transglutaminase-like domain-containing protein [Syntrophales bacterium]